MAKEKEGSTAPRDKRYLPGKGQFPTTAQDEERLDKWIKRKDGKVSRAWALAALVRIALDAEGVRA